MNIRKYMDAGNGERVEVTTFGVSGERSVSRAVREWSDLTDELAKTTFLSLVGARNAISHVTFLLIDTGIPIDVRAPSESDVELVRETIRSWIMAFGCSGGELWRP